MSPRNALHSPHCSQSCGKTNLFNEYVNVDFKAWFVTNLCISLCGTVGKLSLLLELPFLEDLLWENVSLRSPYRQKSRGKWTAADLQYNIDISIQIRSIIAVALFRMQFHGAQ